MWIIPATCYLIFAAAHAADATAAQATSVAVDPTAIRLNFTSDANVALFSITQDQVAIEVSADPFDDPFGNPFAEGSRYFTLTAGVSRDLHIGHIYLTQLSFDDYISDDLAFRWGLTFGYANPEDAESGVQGGPEIGIRWHFFNRERFSTYVDSSVAAVFHQHPLREDTLHFNFDVQVGLGATVQLGDDAHLLGGLRWHHLSNGRIQGKEHNLGYDGPMIYFGIMKSF